MGHSETAAYGLWGLVLVNSLVFLFFAFSFFHPKSRRDWRTFCVFAAFIVALFTEMYGFPLTIYLLSGWLQSRFPQATLVSHDFGHLLPALIGWKGDPHLSPFHIASDLFIIGGFFLLASAWRVLHRAQVTSTLATTGPYARIRHPQYAAFILIMFGFLIQWPTLITLGMFPILTVMYVRLARKEEREVRAELGDVYDEYARVTPAFVPRLVRRRGGGSLAPRAH